MSSYRLIKSKMEMAEGSSLSQNGNSIRKQDEKNPEREKQLTMDEILKQSLAPMMSDHLTPLG